MVLVESAGGSRTDHPDGALPLHFWVSDTAVHLATGVATTEQAHPLASVCMRQIKELEAEDPQDAEAGASWSTLCAACLTISSHAPKAALSCAIVQLERRFGLRQRFALRR